ncbi:hypothetical protein GRF29_185g98509 [Pseudopithomyces chartarum]|uniref:Uncharacterized protein n=1 Tax=Pseudopithomyces chartarum TaxID=1892770 RepID=A0AAN6LNP6_9PLEO|nr:hypothetical protein GRF29_185g98509 [Pseudopithomyces chartarum]
MGVTAFIAAIVALSAFAAGQDTKNCPPGVQVCATACCPGSPAEYGCLNGACLLAGLISGFPTPSTSVTLITTSPLVPAPTPTPGSWAPGASASASVSSVETTVAVPIVSTNVATIVTTSNVTSWSTTAFPTANGTASTDSAHASHSGTDKPKPSGAAGMLVPGGGVLGVVVAAALGAL